MTSWPRSAATRAASSPAGPPPTTTTRRGVAAGTSSASSASRPVAGFCEQREREPAARPAEAALLHADAHPDVVELAVSGLPRHPGVGHQRPGHRDQVARALGEQPLGMARVDDAARVDHGAPAPPS